MAAPTATSDRQCTAVNAVGADEYMKVAPTLEPGACGTVASVKLIAAHEQTSGEYASVKHPMFRGREPIALVQFATEVEAMDAVEKLDESKTNWRGGMGVSLMRSYRRTSFAPFRR